MANGFREDAFTYEIVKPLGVISTRTDGYGNEWSREVNLVAWNHKRPKIDIREWNSDHSKMSKGITMTDDEAEQLGMVLHNYITERSKDDR